jgi:filamentous hemagglutinin family protein
MVNIYFLSQYLKFIKTLSKVIICFCIVILHIAHANPEGGVVSSGNAVINSSQSQVEITQQSPKAVIDWQSFNIEANEQTRFIQPSNDAIALNRIHSNTASEIKGQLTANGKLILINQNGILFGQTAKIDVNGLIATTANISNDKFMQQDVAANSNLLMFDEPGIKDSKIINEGQITAKDGLVGLIATHVVNAGLIIAKAAKVHLASGETFALDLYGDNLIKVAISEDLEKQLLLNSGKIVADGNQIALTAAAGKQVVNSLIANSGALQAKSVANQNGEIIIMAEGSNAVINNATELKGIKSGESKVLVSGTIDVSGLEPGESGGKVQILGDNIALIENAMINASGHSGKYNTTLGLDYSAKRIGSAGGEILVGGDYLGKGKVPAAKMLTVEPTVTVYSDSNEIGDAGRIIFWSDGVNKFNGKVYARSLSGIIGNNYGNGGFVETSGKQLIVNGYVDLAAANGSTGTYLLDPSTISILSNSAVVDPNASQQLAYDVGGSGNTELNANYLESQNADLLILADDVILNLNNDTINLTNNHQLVINARNSMTVTSGGNIFTDGGNITIRLDQNNLDLSNLTLKADNSGKVKVYVVNGTLTLGDVLGTNYLEAISYNYLLGDIIIKPNKQFNAQTINITAFRDLVLDLQNGTLNTASPSIHMEAKRTIKINSPGTFNLNKLLNNNNILADFISKNSMDFTDLDIMSPDFNSGTYSEISFSTANGSVTLGNTRAKIMNIYASGPNGDMWINYGKLLTTEYWIYPVLDNAMNIDFKNNNNAVINLGCPYFVCDKLNFINVPASGATIASSGLIDFEISQGNMDFSKVKLAASSQYISLKNYYGSITVGNLSAPGSIYIDALGSTNSKVILSPNTQFNNAYAVNVKTQHYSSSVVFDLQGNSINLQNTNLNCYLFNGGLLTAISPGTINDLGSGVITLSIEKNSYLMQSNIDLANLTLHSDSDYPYATTTIRNSYGPVTLGNIKRSSLLVEAFGNNNSNITIPSGKKLTINSNNAFGKNPLVLVAEGNIINQNGIGFKVFDVASNGKWVAYYSGAPANNQGVGSDYLGTYTSRYSFNYKDFFQLATQTANTLIFAPSLNANYEDRNVASLNPRVKKAVTITADNLQLVGADAGNYTIVFDTFDANNNPIITGSIGKITPRPVTAILNGTTKVTKKYDGNLKATLSDSHYGPINNVITNDDLHLINNTKGQYTHLQADPSGHYQGVTAYYFGLRGSDVKNYTLAVNYAYNGNAGYIYTASLDVYLTGVSAKVYDGNTVASLIFNPSGLNSNYVFGGVAESDLGTIGLNNYEVGTYDDKNVGRHKLVSVTGLSLSGRAADNYYLDPATVISGSIGVINKRIVQPIFKPEAQVTKVYDGNTVAEADENTYNFENLVTGDSLILRN